MCHSVTLCQSCQKCRKCCAQSSCRSQAPEILANLVTSRCRSKSGSNPKGGLHPTFPKPAKTSKTSHSRKLLCQSSHEQLPVRGITSAYGQKCHRTGKTQNISEFFQPTFPSSQTGQQVAAHTGPQQSEPIPQGREIQNGNSGNYPDLPPTRGVGDLNRFPGCLLPYTNTRAIQEIPEISCPGANISIQSTTFRSVNSPSGVHGCSKGGKTNGHMHGYKNPPVPRRLVGQSHIPPGLLSTHSGSGSLMPKSRLVGESGQVGTGTETSLRLRRLSIRPQDRSGPTDTGPVAKPSGKDFRDLPACPVRQFMSLIGLLTATEKQVHLGRLHMRPIQWHLKNNWRIPESLEKIIPLPRSLHPHLQWWMTEKNVLLGQPLHPLKHALQIFTDASKEGWGAHLNERMARGS